MRPCLFNQALHKYIDLFVLCYLDNIVVFSKIEEKHIGHVRLVLQKLREYNLYVKFSKCTFNTKQIESLKFVVGQAEISMESSKVDTIATWPVFKTQCQVQVFFGFANFYCRFILGFSKVAAVFSATLKGGTNGKFKGVKFVWIKKR